MFFLLRLVLSQSHSSRHKKPFLQTHFHHSARIPEKRLRDVPLGRAKKNKRALLESKHEVMLIVLGTKDEVGKNSSVMLESRPVSSSDQSTGLINILSNNYIVNC